MQNELLVVLVDSDLVGQWLVLVSSHNSVPDAVWIGVNDMDELWLIDAGRLKRVLQNFERHLIEAGLPKRAEVVKSIIKGLKMQPKIDAVPVVHGRWLTLEEYAEKISADPTGYAGGWRFCSECEQPMRELYGWAYCPNCGAKMDGDFSV